MQFETAECRDAECRALIVWARTARGKLMPVDAVPAETGNVLLAAAGGIPTATVVDPNTPPLGGWPGTLHTSHFVTCPAADRWRHQRGHR